MTTMNDARRMATIVVMKNALLIVRKSLALLGRHPVALVIGATVACAYVCRSAIRGYVGARAFTWAVDKTTLEAVDTNLRASFRQIEMREMSKVNGAHSHNTSAADRTAATDAIDTVIKTAGYAPYSVSMSQRDDRVGQRGSRQYHFAKDCHMKSRDDTFPINGVYKMIDVDYYTDIKWYLARMRPIIMYAFVPRRVTNKIPDGVYTVNQKNEVVVSVNGGARYQHQLWDYDSDHLIVDFWFGSVIYLIESAKTADPDRRVIGLFPVRMILGPLGWFLPGRRLEHRQFIQDGLSVSRYMEGNELRISVAQPNTYADVDMAEKVLLSTVIRVQSKAQSAISDVERMLRASDIEEPHLAAPVLHNLITHVQDYLKIRILTDTAVVDKTHYQTLFPLVTEDGKMIGRVIAPSMVRGNVIPVVSYNNDHSCIEGRVVKPRNPVAVWPQVFHHWADEYLELLIPEDLRHSGVPMTMDEVSALQARPTQVAGWLDAKATAFMHAMKIKSFQKAETYQGIKYPRNISTVNADHRTRYGGYMYAITNKLLKATKWYAFGKTPAEVAASVVEMAKDAKWVVCTDFSSWDGTHNRLLYDLENRLGKMFFNPAYHPEWEELIMSQSGASGITKQGVPYNSGDGRKSGSSDTGPFNSVDNSFIAYCVLRQQGFAAPEAWKRLGIYGGDDGATVDVDVVAYERLVVRMGHSLKAEMIFPGNPVPFLGRYFLDPWSGPESVIDIQRQVRKLHLTVSPLEVDAKLALVRKAESYLVTDFHTPIIGVWARSVLRMLPNWTAKHRLDYLVEREKSWWSKYGIDEQFPQFHTPYGRAIAYDFAATQLKTDVCHIHEVEVEIAAAASIADLPSDCFDLPLKADITAVLGGEIFHPPTQDVPVAMDPPSSGSTPSDLRGATPKPSRRLRRPTTRQSSSGIASNGTTSSSSVPANTGGGDRRRR